MMDIKPDQQSYYGKFFPVRIRTNNVREWTYRVEQVLENLIKEHWHIFCTANMKLGTSECICGGDVGKQNQKIQDNVDIDLGGISDHVRSLGVRGPDS